MSSPICDKVKFGVEKASLTIRSAAGRRARLATRLATDASRAPGAACHDSGCWSSRSRTTRRVAGSTSSTGWRTRPSDVDGAYLLDRTSDPSHNRSVLTLAGEAPSVEAALEATIAIAIELIDMELHEGEHPRIGAVDVVPFVPLGSTTMDDCVALARSFGARVAERFELPVYLYARAATRPDRVRLADVRRGGYEGVRDEIVARAADRAPDFGPRRTHPRAGAVAVGARPFLIAWNINLDTDDVEVAKRIARQVRESGGGLPAVQAQRVHDRGARRRPGLDEPARLRADADVARLGRGRRSSPRRRASGCEESELIGLAPAGRVRRRGGARRRAGRTPMRRRDSPLPPRYLRLRDAQPAMVLEQRLAAARAAGG